MLARKRRKQIHIHNSLTISTTIYTSDLRPIFHACHTRLIDRLDAQLERTINCIGGPLSPPSLECWLNEIHKAQSFARCTAPRKVKPT